MFVDTVRGDDTIIIKNCFTVFLPPHDTIQHPVVLQLIQTHIAAY